MIDEPQRRPRIVVADDHRLILERVVAILGDEFLVVGTAADGQSLIDADAHLRPDAVVVDVFMPDMSGLEAAARMRSAGSRAAIVCLTAHLDDEICDAALAAGVLGFVAKTFLATDLLPAVRAALAGRRFASSGVPVESRRS